MMLLEKPMGVIVDRGIRNLPNPFQKQIEILGLSAQELDKVEPRIEIKNLFHGPIQASSFH